ncbi:MAG: hypothetical protein PHC70_05080 [Patescibacteria group bacterium]|nr:hypothetical protein [Patescibacteria group bacterium]
MGKIKDKLKYYLQNAWKFLKKHWWMPLLLSALGWFIDQSLIPKPMFGCKGTYDLKQKIGIIDEKQVIMMKGEKDFDTFMKICQINSTTLYLGDTTSVKALMRSGGVTIYSSKVLPEYTLYPVVDFKKEFNEVVPIRSERSECTRDKLIQYVNTEEKSCNKSIGVWGLIFFWLGWILTFGTRYFEVKDQKT